MNKKDSSVYASPEVVVFEIEVEKGFAASSVDGSINGWGDQGNHEGTFWE